MIRGTFLGIEVSKKGLLTARAGLDTTSHNISNANTEGYSRQRVNLQASYPLSFPGPFITLRPGQVGTGVEISSIERIRSAFIDDQIYREGGGRSMFSVMSDIYARIEDIFAEPTTDGTGVLIEDFFNAWEDLSNDPESTSARTNLREIALTLTENVNLIDFKLKLEISNLNEQIRERVSRLNNLSSQVAEVNMQIRQLESGSSSSQLKANDLKDRRDLLVEEISTLVNARVIYHQNGEISVLAQGHPLVSGEHVNELGLRENRDDPLRPEVVFAESRIPLSVNSGELNGLLRMRDEEIPAVQARFANLISAFINRVNVLHNDGYGLDGNKGRPFFVDNEHRRVLGTMPLPTGTDLDTSLAELGITYGDFFIQGQRVVIEEEEVLPDNSITLGDLFERIEETAVDVRIEIDNSLGFPRIRLSQYNPPSADTSFTIKDGTSNFFEVAGLDSTNIEELEEDPPYQNSLYNFSIHSSILADLDTIAAAGDDGLGFPGPGDNRTALAIADLKNDNTALFGTTFNEYFQSTITVLGSTAQSTEQSYNSQQLLVEQLESRRQEISGVNLDEEAVNLIRFQKAFEASARALTTIDEILSLIVNRLGLVGR